MGYWEADAPDLNGLYLFVNLLTVVASMTYMNNWSQSFLDLEHLNKMSRIMKLVEKKTK